MLDSKEVFKILNNKEVLKRFEKVLLHIDASPVLGEYLNKVEGFINNIADKTGIYKEVIRLWLDGKLELKENDLRKINDYLDVIENKGSCVNLLTAIVKGYIHIKLDLDDEFTNDFVKDIHNHVKYEADDNEEWLKRTSIEIYNKRPIEVRDILFVMSYIHVEEEYNDILKKLMVYKVEQY